MRLGLSSPQALLVLWAERQGLGVWVECGRWLLQGPQADNVCPLAPTLRGQAAMDPRPQASGSQRLCIHLWP